MTCKWHVTNHLNRINEKPYATSDEILRKSYRASGINTYWLLVYYEPELCIEISEKYMLYQIKF